MKITLPYPPTANTYWRHVGNRVVKSAEARQYQSAVRLRWLTQEIALPVLTGPVSVIVTVFRPRRIGDLDNTLKVLLDSLRGLAFVDDSQVVEIHAIRFDDKANPRAVVTVEPILSDARFTRSTPANFNANHPNGVREGAKR